MPYKDPKDPRKLARVSAWQIKQQFESRLVLLSLLGGRCMSCGYDTDTRALCIDHIGGGGTAEGRRYGWTRYRVIAKKVQAGSKEYQVLCANCNQIKKSVSQEQTRKIMATVA